MALEQELLLAGRILLGGFFAVSGFNHFKKTEQLTGWVESKELPAPRFLVLFSGGQLLLGGLGLILGSVPVVSSGALASFLIVATPIMHTFWKMEGEDREQHMVDFMKNAALLGGILFLVAFVESGTSLEYALGPMVEQLL